LQSLVASSSKADVDPTDPAVQLRCLEAVTLCRPGSKLYRCHIADKAKYLKYAKDEDNIIFGTSDFHDIFDGRMTESGLPEVALQFDSSEEVFIDNSRMWKVFILMEFYNIKIANYMSRRLKDGTTQATELIFRTFIFANDVSKIKLYLDIKYAQTKELWGI
jgi:hypothetical protein